MYLCMLRKNSEKILKMQDLIIDQTRVKIFHRHHIEGTFLISER